MTVVVNNLEKDGIVRRSVDKKDKRAFYVQLTAKGKRLFQTTLITQANFISELVSVLTETEQIELGNLLKKLGTEIQGAK